jgi:hypothetical protein
MDAGIAQDKRRAAGRMTLNKLSPTNTDVLKSKIANRWSPGHRLTAIHVAASVGRSGVVKQPSMGCRPIRVPL